MNVMQFVGPLLAGVGSAGLLLMLDALVGGRKRRPTRLMIARPVETWNDDGDGVRVPARILRFRRPRASKPPKRDHSPQPGRKRR